MKTKQILQYVVLGCGAIALITQALAMLLQYDVGTHYFAHAAALPILAVAAAFLAAIAGIAIAVTTPCNTETADVFPAGTQYASIITAIGFAIAALLLGIYRIGSVSSNVTTLTLLTSVGSAAYATATCSAPMRSRTNSISLLGFLAPISCVLWNAYYYFDTAIEMNSPIKTTTQIGLLFAMLYLLSELRFLMGQPLPRMFLASAYLTAAFGALSALSVPIAYFTGKCDRLDYVAGSVLTLCILIAAILRANTLMKSAKE